MKKCYGRSINVTVSSVMLLLIAAFFAGCGDEQDLVGEDPVPHVVLAPGKPDENFVPDEILVKFVQGTPGKAIAAINTKHGAVVKSHIPRIDVKVLKVPKGQVLEKVKVFSQNPNVVFAEPNYIVHILGKPMNPFSVDDPLFSEQWGLVKIEAAEAWNITQGDAAIKIAILDTGIDADHEDLAGKVKYEKNFGSSPTFDDIVGHGTHVAGIAAAATNNTIGVAGVGYNCSLMNIKVTNDRGLAAWDWIASGIVDATDNGANVINMSLGAYNPSQTVEDAVNYSWDSGVVLVAAAGGLDNTTPIYPAGYEHCIAVAASDNRDRRAEYSNYGEWVDVAAPGVNILSTVPNDAYRYYDGTSMATSYVAGLAGFLWSTGNFVEDDNLSVRDRLQRTCAPVKGGKWVRYGRINMFKAVWWRHHAGQGNINITGGKW